MPKTLVGKVAYRVLEDEEKAKQAAQSGKPAPAETKPEEGKSEET